MEVTSLPASDLVKSAATGRIVLGFYDLTCPFCYVAQNKNAILATLGAEVIELPFQAHPEIPAAGLPIPERTGPMYDAIAEVARRKGLPLRWQPRLPNSRLALAAAEWVRQFDPVNAHSYRKALFAAHFAEERPIDDLATLLVVAAKAGVDDEALRIALVNGSALKLAAESETLGRALGVTGTPTWASHGTTLIGNRPARDFERFAAVVRSRRVGNAIPRDEESS